VHPVVRGCPGGWRYVAEELGPPGMYSRTIRMPTYGDAALHLLDRDSTRKIANPRPPGSRDAAQRDSWRFARQVGTAASPALRRETCTWLGLCQDQSLKLSPKARDRTAGASGESPCDNRENRAKVQHMEGGYTQLGTVLIDQRLAGSEEDGVIVVGRFKGDPCDGVQLSYDAGRRKLSGTSVICRPGEGAGKHCPDQPDRSSGPYRRSLPRQVRRSMPRSQRLA